MRTYIHKSIADKAQTPDAANCHVVKTVLKYCHVKENFPNNSKEIFRKDCPATKRTDCTQIQKTNLNMTKELKNDLNFETDYKPKYTLTAWYYFGYYYDIQNLEE